MTATDAQLAAEASRGDAPAFTTLVERYRAPLIGYLIGLLRSRDDAEELAQEAFLRAWRKLPGLEDKARFAGWLYRIAHNLSVNRIRRPGALPLVVDVPQHPGEDDAEDRRIALLAAVSQLDDLYRDVIARKHFAGRSCQSIAEELEIAEGTVRSRLSRAYSALRENLSAAETTPLR